MTLEEFTAGSVWHAGFGEFIIVVLSHERDGEDTLLRCLTLTTSHPKVPPGGVELWHSDNLKHAWRIA